MIAVAVDDERWALNDLVSILKTQEKIDAVSGFMSSSEALEWCSANPFDIAFLDINMRGLDGIELAKRMREINKNCYIIFCTGFDDHSLAAIELHCNAYLLKPILPEKVKKELDYIGSMSNELNSEKLLIVRCYGGFEVFDKSMKPLNFKRTKAKELLAILVDRNGVGISTKDICARLFEDDGSFDIRNQNYVYKLMQELNRVLKEVGAEEILKKGSSSYYLDMSLVGLDDTGKGERGYMEGFSWS